MYINRVYGTMYSEVYTEVMGTIHRVYSIYGGIERYMGCIYGGSMRYMGCIQMYMWVA